MTGFPTKTFQARIVTNNYTGIFKFKYYTVTDQPLNTKDGAVYVRLMSEYDDFGERTPYRRTFAADEILNWDELPS